MLMFVMPTSGFLELGLCFMHKYSFANRSEVLYKCQPVCLFPRIFKCEKAFC